jgi:DNA polymerase III subunit delta'
MRFADIPGLEFEKKRIRSFVSNRRLPHAMILHGPEGSAKLALALALTNLIQCLSPAKEEPCGICNACQKSFKLIHPDNHYFFPLAGGKEINVVDHTNEWRNAVLSNPYLNATSWQETIAKENKLLNISAAECRNMVKTMSMTIYEGNYRVLLVWLPEYLGHQGNILLKLVEEPPENSLILLVTENFQALLPTLVSRCQAISIPSFADSDIHTALMTVGIKDDILIQNITGSVEGNMSEALMMAKDQINPHSEKMILWLRLCFKKKAEDLILWCDSFASEGRDVHRQFLKYGLKYIEQVLYYKITQTESEGFNADEWKGIKGLAQQLSIDDIRLIDELFSDHMYYIERNANPKVLFTALSLNLSQILNHTVPTLIRSIS